MTTTSEDKPFVPAAAKLRILLAQPDGIVVGPGVYDGITARIALKAGFESLYMVWPLLFVSICTFDLTDS